MSTEDFYEDDEPIEEVEAAFAAGDPGVTAYPLDESDLTAEQMDALAKGGEVAWLGHPPLQPGEHLVVDFIQRRSYIGRGNY